MRIYYIDDDPDEVLLFCDAVNEIDSSIECFGLTDSRSGLNQLASTVAPDLIFLDYNMPACSGEECLIQIKRIDHLKAVPVVIYSTGVSEQQKKRLLTLGASMVIKKHNSVNTFKDFFSSTFLAGAHLK